MSEQQKEYWKPSVTADIVVVNTHLAPYRDNGTFVNLVLIKRSDKTDAYPNHWALPGGFLDKGESIEQCAVRELKEETGLEAQMLLPIGVFSNPDRDPRSQVISQAFMTILMSTPEKPLEIKAGDDATEYGLFNLKGSFEADKGVLEVNMKCVEKGVKIAFTTKFGRGAYGLIESNITFKEGEGYSKLAFDHAEIISRAILRAPDLVLPTSTKKK